MARLSIEQKVIKALKDGDTELAQQLAATIKDGSAVKAKTTKKKTVKPTTKSKGPLPKSPKAPSSPPDAEFEINVRPFNKEAPKLLFFDDGSCKEDSRIDKKLLKTAKRGARREPVKKIEVECFICHRRFSDFAHNLHVPEGESELTGLCLKCSSNKAPR